LYPIFARQAEIRHGGTVLRFILPRPLKRIHKRNRQRRVLILVGRGYLGNISPHHPGQNQSENWKRPGRPEIGLPPLTACPLVIRRNHISPQDQRLSSRDVKSMN
jgi:hypothetical protein